MKSSKNIWSSLLNIGVIAGLEKKQIKKIRLLNSILFTAEVVLVVLLIKGVAQGIQEEIYVPIVGMFIFAVPIICNGLRYHAIARVLCILAPLVFLGGLTIFWGTQRGTQMIIYAASGLAVLFFDKTRDLVILSILAGMVLIGVTLYNFSHDPFYLSPNLNSAHIINVIITLVLIFAISFRFKKENYLHLEEIAQKGERIEEQNKQLITLNNSVNASIEYAKTIQLAILPTAKDIEDYLSEHFIFFSPRDIVSGDFYYVSKSDDKLFLAAVDCTGHGVPGAFMSMIGYSLLVEAIEVKGYQSPKRILEYLQKRVSDVLHQETTENTDGMDLALLVFDKNNKSITYAGAKNPLLIYDTDGNLEKYDGDRCSIGGNVLGDLSELTITEHQINVSKPCSFYIYSDGFQDQFGGDNDRKFGRKKFRQLLSKISSEPIDKQQKVLHQELNNWKKDFEQTDDILVIGSKVSWS